MKISAPVLVFVLLLGVVVGLGLGQVLLGGASEPASVSAAGLADASPMTLAPGSTSSTPALSAPTVAAPTELVRSTAAPSAAEVDRVVRTAARVSAQPVAMADGAGSIHGSVLDEFDQPVEGVVVRLEGAGTGGGWDSASSLAPDPAGLSVEAELAREARRRLAERGARREARTGVDGTYRLEGLPTGVWRIAAYADGAFVRRVGSNSSSTTTGARVDFVASAAVPVPVEVVGVDGAAVPEAVLYVRSVEASAVTSRVVLWRPDDALLYLTPGSHTLTAYVGPLVYSPGDRPDASEARSEPLSFLVGVDGVAVPIRVQVEASDVVWGTVSIAGSAGRRGSPRVGMVRLEDGAELDDAILPRDNRSDGANSAGQFAFVDRSPGRYALLVSLGWNEDPISRELLEYAGGVLRHDVAIDLESAGEDRRFRLTVLDPGGAPLGGVSFSAGSSGSNGERNFGGIDHSVRGGAYVVTLPEGLETPEEAGGETEVWIQASHSEFGKARRTFGRGEREGTIQFATPAFAVVTVGQLENVAVNTSLMVSVRSLEEPRGRGSSETVDESGYARCGGFEPGPYRITLTLREQRSRWSSDSNQLDSIEIDLRPGDNAVHFDVPALDSFRVTVPEGERVRRFTLESTVAANPPAQSTTVRVYSGAATFSQIEPGAYRLRDDSDPPRVMNLSVPTGDVEFAGRSATAAEVRIDDGAGRLAQIGLASGDRIVGVGGSDYGSQGSHALVIGALRSRTGIQVLQVRRSSGTVELTFDCSELTTTDWGGSITAVDD